MPVAQTLVPVASLLGFSTASFLTAYITSFSITTVPALAEAPSSIPAHIIAKQWNKAYELGKATAPPFALVAAGCFAYLAYQSRGRRGRLPISPSVLFATAAILAPSIVPVTILVMGPTTLKPLIAKALGGADAPADALIMGLLWQWSGQNLVRAALVGTSALLSGLAIWSQTA